jgi:hypothetical protein
MKSRNYKGVATPKTEKSDNPTLDFFIKFLNGEDATFNTLQTQIKEFVLEGFELEGRDTTLALPNALGFLFVLETSGRKVKQEHIFDALESSIANTKITDEDVSRYAWGILRRIEGWER